MALTEKQKRFVAEYLVDLNATQAAIRADYSEKTARSIGQRLLTNVDIQAAIQEAIAKRSERTEITQDRVLQELARVAFANGTDFARVVVCEEPVDVVDEDGELKQVVRRRQMVEILDTEKVDQEKRAAISSIKEGKYGIEVSSYDKVRALELLGKHLGMFDQKMNNAPDTPNNLIDQLTRATEEDLDTDDLPEVK